MNKQILHIDSSLHGSDGHSSQLSAALVAKLQRELDDTTVTHHSLALEDIPHYSAQTLSAIRSGDAQLADRYIAEIQAADYVVISAPMYNFAAPSQLKAWFDHISRVGVTFRYGDKGPIGLLTNKKVYVVTTRGGLHRGKSSDSESQWLLTILNFLGMDDVDFIYAEGLNMSQHKDQGLTEAETHIAALTLREVA